jgi:hypothetical protein
MKVVLAIGHGLCDETRLVVHSGFVRVAPFRVSAMRSSSTVESLPNKAARGTDA